MDTVTKAAILVDWDVFRYSKPAREYVLRKMPFASIILLVSDPAHNDFDYDLYTEYEFDAVIRNSERKPLSDYEFKKNALALVQKSDNLIAVVGIDYDWFVLAHYEEQGVIETISGNRFDAPITISENK